MPPAPINPQDLRSFLSKFEAEHPGKVVYIKDEVNLDYDTTAITFEYEKHGSPILIFENVKGSRFPVIMNLFGARDRFAAALGVTEDKLIDRWANNDVVPVAPKLVTTGPVLDVVLKGADVDLNYLPIMRHFIQDGGSYLTNAMFIAKDPETGVRNASFHRVSSPDHHRFRSLEGAYQHRRI